MTAQHPTPLLRHTEEAYGAEYRQHFFEQYKLYVEMADRVSARRLLANSFFVGIHTALITAFTVLLKERLLSPTFLGMVPFGGVLLLCYVWWRVVYAYRQLNTGKYQVIRIFEQLLPAAPYDAEWLVLGEGRTAQRYLPLTQVENWVPGCFVLLYVLLALSLYLKL